jgi:hypothetical protein
MDNRLSRNRLGQFFAVNPFQSLRRGVQFIAMGAALLAAQSIRAQAPALLWTNNVGARLFAVDSQTNVYAGSNGTIIVLNSAGIPVQTNVLGQLPGRAQRDAAGNFYYAGVIPAFNSGGGGGGIYQYGTTNACFLAKFSPAGSLIWSNGFGPTGPIRGIHVDDVQVDTNGNAYAGITYNVTTSDFSCAAARFDSTGSNSWTMAMPKNQNFISTTIGAIRLGALSSTNGYALTYKNNNLITWDLVLSRFDNNGSATVITNWSESFNFLETPPPIFDLARNFYTPEAGVTKRDGSGAIIWQSPGILSQWPVGADFYGGVHVSSSNAVLSRVDSDGNLVWSNSLPSTCIEMVLDASGNRFLALGDGTIARLGAESPTGPSITNPPQPLTVFSGSNAVFSVGANGFTPFRYFWYFNNSLLTVQSNGTLTIPAATTNQAGSYKVVVSNFVNSVTSAPVQLRVKQVELFVGNQLLTNGTYTFTTNPVITMRSAFTNGSAFYTLDGSAPNFSSTFYSGPFQLFSNVTVRALGYSADFSQSEEADAINAIVLAHHSLTASTSGGGSITLNPPGGDYFSSDTVTATAVPNAGWSFLYWTGDASGSSNPIDLAMHSDKTIHAVFGTTLSTTVQGNGQVLLYPPGGLYSYGQTVRLTAVPGSGSYFGFWGNAATGNTNPLYFKVTNANPVISSIFGTNGANQVTLTVNINGRGNVTVSPQANVYSTGQSLTLTATAGSGQSFVNWTGDASGAQNPLGIVLNQNQVITANFTGGPMLRVSPQLGEGFHPEGFRFSLLSDPDSIYEIRYSSNLISWSSLGFVTNQLGEASLLDSNAVTAPQRFYRIKP